MARYTWVLIAVLSLMAIASVADARTMSYWDSVSAILSGENFYDILKVSPPIEMSELKKAFRTVSKEFHPDRNPSPAATEMYLKITMAFDILSNDETREEYDHLLKYGVPTQDRYYGRYAHKVGIPDHNPWIVFPTLFAVATGVHYLMSWNHYRILMRAVKRSNNYKIKRYQNMVAAGLDVKLVKKLEKSLPDYEPADDDPYAPPIHIYGGQKPTLWDLLPLKIIFGIFNFIIHFNDEPLSDIEKLRRHMELRDRTVYSVEDAQAELKKMQDKQRQVLGSAKYKKWLRWQKKQ
jgi:hypothetical protein